MNNDISLDETRKLVDECMADVVERRKLSAAEVGESYAALWDHISEVVFAGGKRLRPYLTMVGNGSVDPEVVPIAAAQELVHIAMLIHDDVIDQDFVRHGQNNISGVYRDVYAEHLDEKRATHYAHSAAILAGDALISEAYYLVSRTTFDAEIRRKIVQQLHNSIFEVIGGELMDVESGFVKGKQFDPMQIYRYKTSSYSFIGPLLSGAYCAEADQDTINHLEKFATNVGIAFQIQDDLHNVFGDEQKTGKPTTTDIREGKRTLLVKFHEESMNDEQRQRFELVFANSGASEDDIRRLSKDIINSGAKQQTVDQVQHYFDLAINELNNLPADNRTSELMRFAQRLHGRSS